MLDGVCDHPASRAAAAFGARVEVVRVGDAGGETAVVGVAWFAIEVRVARLRGELSAVDWAIAAAVFGSGNSFGWFRVATILATQFPVVGEG